MKSLRYLNVVLTVIALLLTLNLWTLWTTSPSTLMQPPAAQAQGVSNAGAQRNQMIALLKQQVQRTEELTGLFKSGKARVRVDNAPANGR